MYIINNDYFGYEFFFAFFIFWNFDEEDDDDEEEEEEKEEEVVAERVLLREPLMCVEMHWFARESARSLPGIPT